MYLKGITVIGDIEMSNIYRGSSIDASYQVLLVSFGQAASEEKLF
jgi:hypothetical protein